MADLFNPKTVRRLCQDVVLTDQQKANAEKWLKLIEDGKLRDEKNNYLPFANTILEGILDYPVNNSDLFEFERNNVEFSCTMSNDKSVCIEAKGMKVTNLFQRQNYAKKEQSTPIKQLWGYMSEAEYGICTNYKTFVLLIREYGISRYYQFDFDSIRKNKTKLNESKLKEFVYIFSKHSIENDFVTNLHEQSEVEEKELTDEFYNLFHTTRLMMIKEFQKEDVTKNMSIHMTQIFLNRMIFWFFAKDRGFVSKKLFYNKITALLKSEPNEHSKAVFSGINDMFTLFDKGSDKAGVFGFNGGLFSGQIPSNVYFNDLKENKFFKSIPQNYKLDKFISMDENTQKISKKHHNLNPIIANLLLMDSFDFSTDVNVNILGHIFEQSIADLEEIQGKKVSKRKKEGVYYTPEYITEYICRNTIIPYLSKSGKVTDAYDLVNEYQDIAELEKKFRELTICDPACGSGAFLVKAVDILLEIHKAIQELKESQGKYSGLEKYNEAATISSIIETNIYGVDVNQEAVEISRLAMFFKTASEKRKLPDLSKNILVGNSLISNKDIPDSFLWREKFPELFFDEKMQKNIDIDHENGFSIIIGNPPYVRQETLENKEHMQVPKGSGLAEYVIPNTTDLSCYFFFHGLDILKKNGKIGFIASDSWMSYDYGKALQKLMLGECNIEILLKTKFNVFDDADVKTVTTILGKTKRKNNPVKLIYAKKQSDLFKSGMKHDVIKQNNLNVGNWNLHFVEYEMAPKIGMVELSTVGNVKRGKTTGYNDFFVLPKEIIEEYKITEKYRKPIISRGIHEGVLIDSDVIEYLLDVNDPKGRLVKTEEGNNVLRYIEKGENTSVVPKRGKSQTPRMISELSTVSGRKMWYSLGLQNPPSAFLSQIIDRRLKMYENNGKFYSLDVFAYFTPTNHDHLHAFLAYFASSWFSLYMEQNGHPMGGGALKFQIYDYKSSSVPDFEGMSKSNVEKMKQAWLEYRDDFDQKKLDRTVCGVLGFTKDETTEIQKELEHLIKQRTESKK